MAEPKGPKNPPVVTGGESFDLADEPAPTKPFVDAPIDPTADDDPIDDESEPTDSKRPQVGSPARPLPRLWKGEPEDEPEPEKPSKKGKKAKADDPVTLKKKTGKEKSPKVAKETKEGEPKGVLKEETPTFDTYEARQRVRIIAGVGVTSVFLLVGFILYKVFSPASEPVAEGNPPSQDAPGFVPSSAARPSTSRTRTKARAFRAGARGRQEQEYRPRRLALAFGPDEVPQDADRRRGESRARPPRAGPAAAALPRPPGGGRQGRRPSARASAPAARETRNRRRGFQDGRRRHERRHGEHRPAGEPRRDVDRPARRLAAPSPSPAQVRPSRPLPNGYRARPGSDTHESGWPLELVGDRDGAPMVFVPGDTFIQGRDDADANEGPSHKVTLGAFYIDRHEVTVRQFNLFQKEAGMRSERVRALAKDHAHAALDAEEDRPVVMVSARDAKAYADWAGKFLPTEAQWEAAARTPDGRIYPWGPTPPAWNRPRAPRQIDPIMSFPSDVSPYGAFDLAGNAWEWTKDWYDAKYYQQFRNAAADNPGGPVKPRSQQLVVKGAAKDWSASKREGFKFDIRLPYLGFRCVLQVEGPGNVFEPPPAAPPPGQPAAPGGSKVVVPF